MALIFGQGIIIGAGSENPVSGIWIPLGDINENDGDGDFNDGAIPLNENMSITNAIDTMNQFLKKLVPEASDAFPTSTLNLDGYVVGENPRLCIQSSGTIPDNTGGGTLPSLSPGDDVTNFRGISATVTSDVITENNIENFGPAYFSAVSEYTNNILGGTLTFTGATGDTIDSAGLEIINNKWYPEMIPNFNQVFDVRVHNAPSLVGWNRYSILYDDGLSNFTPSSEIYVLRDNVTVTPSIVSASVVETTPIVTYSSGIPHYNSGTVLTMTNVGVNNLSGYTYSNDDPFYVSANSNGLFSTAIQNIGYGDVTPPISVPVDVNVTGITVSIDLTLNAVNSHVADWLKVRAHNVNGYSAFQNVNSISILYKNGTSTGVTENAVSAPNLSVATKVELVGLTDTVIDAPNIVGGLLHTPPAMSSSQDLSALAYVAEATVVGGVLKHDVTDYSTGFLPVGASYAGKNAVQYATYAFTTEYLSNITINIDGTYSGIWIGLEDYSDNAAICPNSDGGTWWDAFVPYNGSGLPGRLGASSGCSIGTLPTGNSGLFPITFGTANTSKEPNGNDASVPKTVYVRIRLTAGEEISELTIS